jgi:hypothetical protein
MTKRRRRARRKLPPLAKTAEQKRAELRAGGHKPVTRMYGHRLSRFSNSTAWKGWRLKE